MAMPGRMLQTFTELSPAARRIMLGVLITNIGNGMHTIAVGKILYDHTGSVSAFGFALLAEYIISFLLQFVAGSVVDRRSPVRVSIWCDVLRGIFICFVSLMLLTSAGLWWVFASVLVINIAKPFYRSATFAIGPAVASGDSLVTYNALLGSFLQIGQLLGVALVGAIIQNVGAEVAFAGNGISFLLSALCIWLARVPPIPGKEREPQHSRLSGFFKDWQEIGALLLSNKTFVWHIILCAGDFLAVSFVNLALVPLVTNRFGNNNYWLSAFDGAFAVGAMLAAGLVQPLVKYLRLQNATVVGITVQGLLFLGLAALYDPYAVVLAMFFMGMMNAFSLSVFLSRLQQRSRGPIKGRIAGVRHFVLSVLALVVLPAVSFAQGQSLTYGLIVSGLICLTFGLVTYVLSRPYVFGIQLVGAES